MTKGKIGRFQMDWQGFQQLIPFMAAQLIMACTHVFPAATMDHLLASFHWREGDFGNALFVQTLFTFVGSIWVGGLIHHHWDLRKYLQITQAVMILGAILIYFSDGIWELFFPSVPWMVRDLVRYFGFAVLGFGVGVAAIVHNTMSMRLLEPNVGLMLIAVAYTIGAVASPFIAGQYISSLPLPTHWNWRFPLLGYWLISILLIAWLSVLRKNVLPQKTNVREPVFGESKMVCRESGLKSYLHHPSFLTAGLLLLLYLGIESCFSNGLILLGIQSYSFDPNAARMAPTCFWSGILISRIYTSFWPPEKSTVPQLLLWFSLGLVAAIGVLTLGLASWIWVFMALSALIGFALGPIYGFLVGLPGYLAAPSDATYRANQIAATGVLGAIILPISFTKVLQYKGMDQAMIFILVLSVLFAIGCLFLLRYVRRQVQN